jgi:hypothetical protein
MLEDPLLFLFLGFWWFIIKIDVWIVMKKWQASLRQTEDASKSCRIIWLKYVNVIAPRKEGFEMIKVVNLCNHCDINKKLCTTHLFFVWWLHLFRRGEIKHNQYSLAKRHSQTSSTQHVCEHACFRILLTNPKKGMTNGFFVEKAYLENIRHMKW